MPTEYPLPSSEPASLGFAAKPLDHLDRLIKPHIDEGRYPGAQIALARHGKLALFRTYGDAQTEAPPCPRPMTSLFLLFSQTKVLTSPRSGPWWRRASCPSWTRSPTTCRSSPRAAKPTSRCSR